MRSFLLPKLYCLAAIFLLATQASVRAQTYSPIALTSASYTQSIIVPQTATNVVPLCDAATSTMEGGTNNANYTWYEEGYDTAAPTTGLPPAGTTITGLQTYLAPSAPITWGPATTASAATDVATTGTFLAAYCWDVPSQTLNGVTFTKASTTANAQNGTYVLTSSMSGGEYNGFASTNGPYTNLPAAYSNMLSGGVYDNSASSTATVTLTGLTPGRSYLVQLWVNDSRVGEDARADIVSAGGGATVTLLFNAQMEQGGVGQFSVGTFTANAPTEVITLTAVSANVGQVNAIQLRDVTVGTTASNAMVQYTMPPTYATSNALMLDSTTGFTTGTLTLSTATNLTNLSVLCATGNAANVITYSVQHSSGSPETGTFTAPNWLSGSGSLMYEAQGYLNTSSSGAGFSGVNAGTSGPCLYGSQITINNANPVTAVSFTYTSGGGNTCIFALSGNTNAAGLGAGTNWVPLPVTGFNEDMVVEQAAAQPGAFTNFTTATMDAGTGNTGNTFYEMGFNRVAPKTGLPHAGTTFTSISHPNRTYIMAPSYQSLAPDSILVSSAVPTATIVPAAPAAYTAFSVVSAGANIGTTSMSNTLIMQHADGSSETNVFYAYDWFSTLAAALTNKAFSSVGRFNVGNPGTFNDTLTNDDQLFESTFVLKNSQSPVTGMTLKFLGGPSGCTAYIFAVSATAGGFPPVIATQPQSQEWFPSQTATFTVTLSAGTAPLTNIWLVESNGIYYPLPNGVDGSGSTVSGATTMSMSLSGISSADATNYEVIITNAVGSVTSTPALLTINPNTPVGPIIDAQIPPASASPLTVLTNELTGFSVTIDASSAPPISYQWYVGVPTGPATAIPNATNVKYLYFDASNTTVFCIASNFVGTATNSPVSLIVTNPTPYQAAILAYNPVGYWPLTETSGNVAYDIAAGNNGTYEGNFGLGEAGIPAYAGIGANTSVGLDGTTAYVDIPEANLNITNQMTVIQWIQSSFGGNQFVTTMGHGNASYRLDFSPVAHGGNGGAIFADQSPDIISPNAVNDGNWHQLIGVYDIAGGTTNELLYVDGQLEASTTLATAPTGSAYDVWIGGAPDYATAGNTRFLDGNTAQVAILTNALTAAQVAGIYASLGFPPTVSVSPASPELYTTENVTLTAVTTGTTPLAYQWFSIDTSMNSNVISGATNATYAIDQPSLALSGYTYGVIVTNAYGSAEAGTELTVLSQPTNAYVTAVLGDGPIAFFRLDEATNNPATQNNDGVVAHDVVGNHNGYYSNAVLQVPGYSTNDPDDYAAEFGTIIDPNLTGSTGSTTVPQDNLVTGINGINFGSPTNISANFSVEAWVNLISDNVSGAGLVSQGWGGGEQFALDTGGTANAFRFYIRYHTSSSATATTTVSPNTAPGTNGWYHLVGVVNESSNYEALYVNGVLASSNALPTNAGLLITNTAMNIGARQSSAATNFNLQLDGSIDNVAIYPYALTGAQVSNHYNAEATYPFILAEPSPAVTSKLLLSGTITWNVMAGGYQPLSYQWYAGSTNSPVAGATNASYTLTVSSNVSGIPYFCVVSNIYGQVTSTTAEVIGPQGYLAAIASLKPLSYWPLTETSGTIAYDLLGSNNGTYEGDYILGQTGIPDAGLGANTSVNFDGFTAYVDIPVNNLNILGPITVVEFIQTTYTGSTFETPLGHGDNSYRLDVDPAGNNGNNGAHFADENPDITSPNAVTDGQWHQLVGVYNGSKGFLYVDGQLAGSASESTPSGDAGYDLWIGGAPDYPDERNFTGNIAQVAIFTNALTGTQVQALYNSLDVPPTVSITHVATGVTGDAPSTPAIFAGNNITFTALTNGTPSLSLQWYYIDTMGNSNLIAGATSNVYALSGVPLSDNGYVYGLLVENSFGTNDAQVTLAVLNGPPYLPGGTGSMSDIFPLNAEAYAGAPVTYTVSPLGTPPLYYQWMVDGTNYPGATNASFTSPAGCGSHTYEAAVSNAFNGGSVIYSSVATLQGDAYPTNITFTNGAGWQLNGSVQNLTGTVLELTDGGGGEASTAFYNTPQYVGHFSASFVYQATDATADGACFILQDAFNNGTSWGPEALGGGGGSLGYNGISNSAALEIDLYNFVGIAFGTNGATQGAGGGNPYGPTGSVAENSGDPILFQLNYSNNILGVTLTDQTTLATYTTNYLVGSLTPDLGGTDLAYIGFSGGSGSLTAIQTFSNFAFTSPILSESLAVSSITATSFILSWPAADSSYILEQSPDLINWLPGPMSTVVGSLNEVSVALPGSSPQKFYRLIRIVCQ